jgi:hypothetical protein
MKKNLTKLYDQFTGLERLRLVIEAQARGDEAEVARLVQSCPRAHYSSGDNSYTVPLRATFDLVGAVCHDFDRYMGRLQALDVVQCMISGSIEHLYKLDKIPRKRIEDIAGTLQSFSESPIAFYRAATLAKIKELHEAFGKFFQDKLDLPPHTLLKALVSPYWEWLEELQEEISEVEVDSEKVADMVKRLDKSWKLRME